VSDILIRTLEVWIKDKNLWLSATILHYCWK